MKVVVTILYVDELTINLAIDSVRKQTQLPDDIVVIENFCGAKNGITAEIDYGYKCGCDILITTTGDAMMKPNLIKIYLKTMKKRKDAYMFDCFSDDVMLRPAPSGVWVMDMNVLQNKYRPGHDGCGVGLHWDSDFFDKVSKRTGLKRECIQQYLVIHHPIWTPYEMYGKVRATLPRYFKKSKSGINQFKMFFEQGLKLYPDNLTLRVGYDLYNKMIGNLPKWNMNNKRFDIIREEWKKFKKSYQLTGEEFFAMDGWEEIAKKLVRENLTKGKVEISSTIKRVREKDLYG